MCPPLAGSGATLTNGQSPLKRHPGEGEARGAGGSRCLARTDLLGIVAQDSIADMSWGDGGRGAFVVQPGEA